MLADVVEPVNPTYTVTAIDPEVDQPGRVDEQLAWLGSRAWLPRSPGLTEISW